ncbi:hypothetical protein AcV7_008698 [Taiwanofungus camphoratus]|nr:hypothetical protein AcV7_008698 [Antrodia cinnamomea]
MDTKFEGHSDLSIWRVSQRSEVDWMEIKGGCGMTGTGQSAECREICMTLARVAPWPSLEAHALLDGGKTECCGGKDIRPRSSKAITFNTPMKYTQYPASMPSSAVELTLCIIQNLLGDGIKNGIPKPDVNGLHFVKALTGDDVIEMVPVNSVLDWQPCVSITSVGEMLLS